MTDEQKQRIADLNAQIAQRPTAADHLYNEIGEIYGSAGDCGKAVAYFQKALECNPLSGIYYSNLALALSNIGASDEALLNYTKAIAVMPNRMAYNNRACLYIDRKQYAEAVADATAALKLKPTPQEVCAAATLYATRADAYMHLEDYRKALDDLNRGLDSNPPEELLAFFDGNVVRCQMKLGIKPCQAAGKKGGC